MLNQETAKAARTDSGYILRAPRRMRVADAVAQYMRVGMFRECFAFPVSDNTFFFDNHITAIAWCAIGF